MKKKLPLSVTNFFNKKNLKKSFFEKVFFEHFCDKPDVWRPNIRHLTRHKILHRMTYHTSHKIYFTKIFLRKTEKKVPKTSKVRNSGYPLVGGLRSVKLLHLSMWPTFRKNFRFFKNSRPKLCRRLQ